jgi:soluble lytic murein transglycosylase-like protein
MPRRIASPAAFILCGIALASASASAGVLYKCEGPNGSIAYTNKKATFAKCVELSRYADESPASPARHSSKKVTARASSSDTADANETVAGDASSDSPATRERVAAEISADKSAAKDGVAAAAVPGKSPARKLAGDDVGPVSENGWTYRENVAEKPDFTAIGHGVASTAMPLRATDFGVESTAPLVRAAAPVVAGMIASAAPAIVNATGPAASPKPKPPKVLRGAVYRVQRADGITEYTNVKPSKGSAFAVLFTYIATCVACDVHSKIDFAKTALNLDAFKDEIAAAAASSGVDVALLRAVIHAESAFNPMAVSNKGAQGLMQLMPGTAGDLGVTDAFDVGQNIGGGAKYLAQLLKDFNGNTQLATAAYNAGEAAVQKYGGVPPYDETQVYVQRVEQLRDRYKKAL